MRQKFNFYTENHQFYLEDKEKKTEINPAEFWSESDLSDGLALENGTLV